jgi:5-methylcytosine-specific restriction endonuclease McrA
MTQAAFPALVLNADYQPLGLYPLHTVPWHDAVRGMFKNSVDVVAVYDRRVRSQRLALDLPSVIVRKTYVRLDTPAPFTRAGIWVRDHGRCAYCRVAVAMRDVTFDHVLPRCEGNPGGWLNTCLACFACNQRKGRALARQVGMTLHVPLWHPTVADLNRLARRMPPRAVPISWKPFLPFWATVPGLAEPANQDLPAPATSPAFPTGMTDQDYWNATLER